MNDNRLHISCLIIYLTKNCLSKVGARRQQVQEIKQHSPAPPGGYWSVPQPKGTYNASSESWVCSRASSQLDVPENLQSAASRRHPNQMPEPPQLTPFIAKEQWLYSEFPLDGWAPCLISKAEPSQPPKETNISHLYLRSRSFGYYPELMTIGEGLNKDAPVNWKLHLVAQLFVNLQSFMLWTTVTITQCVMRSCWLVSVLA